MRLSFTQATFLCHWVLAPIFLFLSVGFFDQVLSKPSSHGGTHSLMTMALFYPLELFFMLGCYFFATLKNVRFNQGFLVLTTIYGKSEIRQQDIVGVYELPFIRWQPFLVNYRRGNKRGWFSFIPDNPGIKAMLLREASPEANRHGLTKRILQIAAIAFLILEIANVSYHFFRIP